MPSAKRGSRRTKVGLLPDIHIPKHNAAVVRWAVRGLRDEGLRRLVLLGDVVNLDSISRFQKSLATTASLPQEIKEARRFFAWLDRTLGGIPVTYLLGNHEDRLHKYLLKRAPELAELPELEFRRLMKVPAKWKVVPWKDYVMEQGVMLQHGTKWGGATCKHNLRYGCSSVQGHSHRANFAQSRLATGEQIVAVELGALCDFDQGYSKLNDWTHACGWIERGQVVVKTRTGHGRT